MGANLMRLWRLTGDDAYRRDLDDMLAGGSKQWYADGSIQVSTDSASVGTAADKLLERGILGYSADLR